MRFALVLCSQCLHLFLICLHCAEERSFSQLSTLQNENLVSTEIPWLTNLRVRIDQYIKQYGYEDAKPHIEKAVEETENAENILLNVKVTRNGTTSIDFGPVIRSSKRKKEIKQDLDNEPQWMIDFKEFIQNLIQNYGREMSEKMMEHVIKTLEAKHLIKIKDIDGEIFVQYDYVRKSGKRKKGPRHRSSEENLKVTETIQD